MTRKRRYFAIFLLFIIFPAVGCSISSAKADSDAAVFDGSRSMGGREVLRQFVSETGDTVNALAWSPDGKKLLVLTEQGARAFIYDIESGRMERSLYLSEHGTVAWNPFLTNDGHILATFSSLAPNRLGTLHTLALFDSRSGQRIRTFQFKAKNGEVLTVLNLQPSPSGKFVAVWGMHTIRTTTGSGIWREFPAAVFDTESGAQIDRLGALVTTPVESISFLPDESKIVALLSSGETALLKVPTGKMLNSFKICNEGDLACNKIIASPDGRYLVSSGGGRNFRPSRQTMTTAKTAAIRSLPDGVSRASLVSGDDKNTARLEFGSWDPRTDTVAIADTGTLNIWTNVLEKPVLALVRHVPTVNGQLVKYSISAVSYSHAGLLAVAAGAHVIIYK